MHIIEENDKVKLTFIGKMDDGQVFKEVTAEKPIEITIGNNELPPTVESALMGLKVGDKTTIRTPPDESYGPRHQDLVHEIPLAALGNKITPTLGMVLSQKVEKDGEQHEVPATVVEITDDTVKIDYNHPAAGHHLTYDISVLEISKHS